MGTSERRAAPPLPPTAPLAPLTLEEAATHPALHPLTLPTTSPPTLAALAAFRVATDPRCLLAAPPAGPFAVAPPLPPPAVLPLSLCRLPTRLDAGALGYSGTILGYSGTVAPSTIGAFSWPEPALPACDRCGLDCSAELAHLPASEAGCPRCGWGPLAAFYSEIDAYDEGTGGRCVGCGHVQDPQASQCLSCGALVLPAHTDYYYAFGGFCSRELLVAIGRTLALPAGAFAAVLRGGGLEDADADLVALAYGRQVGAVPRTPLPFRSYESHPTHGASVAVWAVGAI